MLVKPKLEYGATSWNPQTQDNIDTLQTIQRRAARFALNDHRRTTSVTSLQHKLGWQTLEQRRLQHQLTFFYKIKHYRVTISLPKHLIVPCTRNSDPDNYNYTNPRVIRAWNLLPTEIIRLPSIHPFQLAVSTFYLAPPAHIIRL